MPREYVNVLQVWKEAAGQHMKCSCVYKHIFYLQNTLVHALAYLPNWTWSIYCNRLNSFTNIFQNIQTITNFTFQHPCLGNSEDQTMQISNMRKLWEEKTGLEKKGTGSALFTKPIGAEPIEMEKQPPIIGQPTALVWWDYRERDSSWTQDALQNLVEIL